LRRAAHRPAAGAGARKPSAGGCQSDTGRRLNNPVLQTEARITLIDGARATAVLVGVLLNAVIGWWWADPPGALLLVFYGAREARHAWLESTQPDTDKPAGAGSGPTRTEPVGRPQRAYDSSAGRPGSYGQIVPLPHCSHGAYLGVREGRPRPHAHWAQATADAINGGGIQTSADSFLTAHPELQRGDLVGRPETRNPERTFDRARSWAAWHRNLIDAAACSFANRSGRVEPDS
jgi:hypothetical protein